MNLLIQEQKDLLLKDLCARLPYDVKCEVIRWRPDGEMVYIRCNNSALKLTLDDFNHIMSDDFYEVKPYLFPLSSMTDEQTEELIKLINTGQNDNNEFMRSLCRIEFYHKNHFDYRGLIPKGLAIDATGKNIY